MKISLKNLDLRYADNVIFESTSIDLDFGNIYLLYGDNGSGKSSLTKILAGYYPVDRSSIIFPKGISYEDISLQFQEIRAFKNLKVRELENYWFRINSNISEDWEELRKFLEIEKIESKLIKHLSGGENRSLIVYLTIIQNKKIIILDEPFAGMDRKKKENLSKFISKKINNNNLYIIVSHEIKGMENIFNKILIIDNAKIHEVKDYDELIRSKIYGV